MEDHLPADVDPLGQLKPQKLETNGSERQQAFWNLVRKRIDTDPAIKRYRQSIMNRAAQIHKQCAKDIDEHMRKEFLLRAKAHGVPVMPHETRRWADDEERHEIIKARK